jgi:hypothetical protein
LASPKKYIIDMEYIQVDRKEKIEEDAREDQEMFCWNDGDERLEYMCRL